MDSWVAANEEVLENTRNSHRRVLQDAHGNIQLLRQQQKDYAEQGAKLRQRMNTEKEIENKLQEEINEVKRTEATMPDILDEIRRRIQKLRTSADSEKEGVEKEVARRTSQVEDLSTAVELYRSRLGLRFECTPERVMRIIFNMIDRTKPEREFVIGIRVEEGSGQYQVLECNPQLAEMDELCQILNTTNDFGGFVRAVRQKFQEKAVQT